MQIRYVVVDDAAFIRELIKNILTPPRALFSGEAADGEEALRLVENTLPDLMFLDMVMPHKNGLEIIAQLKKIQPDLKVIGCSTLDNPNIVSKALAAGFDAYITKPFTKQQMIFEIENLFPQIREVIHE